MLACPECPYTTQRSYNMTRHMEKMHPPKPEEELKDEFAECPDCHKIVYKKNLVRHKESCKEEPLKLICGECHRRFANDKTLKQHKDHCSKSSVVNQSVDNHGRIHTQNNHQNNTNNIDNSTNIVLVFPKDDRASGAFDFLIDHIKDKSVKKCMVGNPNDGFRKFMWKVLQNPANRMVKKSCTKSKYCKVHIGNNRWMTRVDQDVLPEVAHHMTTAAIARVAEAEVQPWYDRMRFAAETFLGHVRTINESAPDEIKYVLDQIRCHLVTLAEYEKQGILSEIDNGTESD